MCFVNVLLRRAFLGGRRQLFLFFQDCLQRLDVVFWEIARKKLDAVPKVVGELWVDSENLACFVL